MPKYENVIKAVLRKQSIPIPGATLKTLARILLRASAEQERLNELDHHLQRAEEIADALGEQSRRIEAWVGEFASFEPVLHAALKKAHVSVVAAAADAAVYNSFFYPPSVRGKRGRKASTSVNLILAAAIGLLASTFKKNINLESKPTQLATEVLASIMGALSRELKQYFCLYAISPRSLEDLFYTWRSIRKTPQSRKNTEAVGQGQGKIMLMIAPNQIQGFFSREELDKIDSYLFPGNIRKHNS